MGKVEVITNYEGLAELRKSPEIAACIEEVARQVKSRAGSGYGSSVHETGGWLGRVIVNIYPETKEAYQDNLENNTLLKAIGG